MTTLDRIIINNNSLNIVYRFTINTTDAAKCITNNNLIAKVIAYIVIVYLLYIYYIRAVAHERHVLKVD